MGGLALGERTELHEIDDGDELSRVAKLARDAVHEARFADPARPEHIAEPSGANRCLELPVGGAFDVAGSIRLHRAADHVKLARVDRF